MGIQEMENGIISEAEKKASSLLEEAKKEREEVLDKQKKKIDMQKEKIKKEFDESALELERKELASARIEVKKQILNKKKEIIDTIYQDFFEQMEKHITKEELISSLFEAGKTQLKDVETVYVNKKDQDAAKKLGVTIKIKNIKGGLILESGSESVDLSIEVLQGMLRSRTLKKVSTILFSGE